MGEVEITKEMVTAGWIALTDVLGYRGDRSLADEDKLLRTIYRAMRALEPPRLACRFCGVESGTVCPRNGMTIAECHDMRRQFDRYPWNAGS